MKPPLPSLQPGGPQPQPLISVDNRSRVFVTLKSKYLVAAANLHRHLAPLVDSAPSDSFLSEGSMLGQTIFTRPCRAPPQRASKRSARTKSFRCHKIEP